MLHLRPLGRTSLATTPFVLGGNVFGWTADKETSFRLLDRFADAGGRMIDTADVYSAWVPGHQGGESETVIGEWLKRRTTKGDVLIATKVGMLPGKGGASLEPDRIVAAAEASLRRLGVEVIDLYYAHQPDENTPIEATLAAFDGLVRAGSVRALGASNYSAGALAAALDASNQNGLARYEVLQPEYNLVARGKFEGALQQLAIKEELGVLPYYGLASGFLTGKYRSPADYAKSVRGARMPKYFEEGGPAVLVAMDEVAAEMGASLAQIALAWVAAQPGISAPIASATSLEQLDELIGAMTLELNADQLRRLAEAKEPMPR